MLHAKNPFQKLWLIVIFAFMAILIAANVFLLADGTMGWWIRAGSVCSILSIISCFLYILNGYSKDQALTYKLFLSLFSAALFFSLIGSSVYSKNTFSVIAQALAFGLVLALTLGKEYGKMKSLVLCVLVWILCVSKLAENTAIHPGLLLGGERLGSLLAIRYASQLIMATALLICTSIKYRDKDLRHSSDS